MYNYEIKYNDGLYSFIEINACITKRTTFITSDILRYIST